MAFPPASVRMTLGGVEAVSLLPIQAMNYVQADFATSVAQARDILFAFQTALVASRAGVLPIQAMTDVWADVATSVAQGHTLLGFQVALVAYWAGVDHLNDVLYLSRTQRQKMLPLTKIES